MTWRQVGCRTVEQTCLKSVKLHPVSLDFLQFSASKQATRKTDKTVKCYCDWTLDIGYIGIHWAWWVLVVSNGIPMVSMCPQGLLGGAAGAAAGKVAVPRWMVHCTRCAQRLHMNLDQFRSIQHVFKLKNLSSIFISRCSQFAKSAKSAKSSVKMRLWTDCLWIHDSAKS